MTTRGRPIRLAERRWRPWTEDDDRAVRAARADDLRRVAILLERTHGAVVARRIALRRRDGDRA
jgi:hypothetical protein